MPSRPHGTAELGFFDGVTALFGGMRFIVTRPSMWGWALIPTLVATVLFFALGGLAVWAGADLADRILTASQLASEETHAVWATAGSVALRIVFWIVGVVLSFVVAMSLAQPISGFALDAIAQRQAADLGEAPWPDQPLISSTLRSLRVSITALVLSLPLLVALTVVTLLFPPASIVTVPLKFLVAGLAAAYDFLDYPLSLRGEGVRSRLSFIRRHFSTTLGFGVAAALLLLVPGLGLVLLPFGVAGAARIVVASGRTGAAR